MSRIQSSLLLDPDAPYIERDLSWLQFNDRVLAEAADPANPLLERLKFLGITAANLDEFFMIRFASLSRDITHLGRNIVENARRLQRLSLVRSQLMLAIAEVGDRQKSALSKITRDLHRSNVLLWRNFEPGTTLYKIAKEVFDEQVLHQLHNPRQFSVVELRKLMNLQLGLLFPDQMFVAVQKNVPLVYWKLLSGGRVALFFLDDLLKLFAAQVFGETTTPSIVRLTRDCDVRFDLESEDPETIPDIVRQGIGTRETRRPLRLQYSAEKSLDISELSHVMRLPSDQVFPASVPLCLPGVVHFVNEMRALLPSHSRLLYPAFDGYLPQPFRRVPEIFSSVSKQDYVFHQPYDSFDSYVNFIEAAASDQDVVEICQTVYRVDALSRVTELLKTAAATKAVTVLIEPRARFDEINNLRLAEDLRAAGVRVHFASGRLKMHAKMALVVRREGDKKVYYAHLSTGNYNAKTARQYTDLAVLTADHKVGEDVKRVFDSAIKGDVPGSLNHLVLAPTGLHRRILSLIRSETKAARQGKPARIFAKVNALIDRKVIRMLYEASQAGVTVELIVRGACSLVPGIPGVSENIRVLSIVDRYLEHSRIYYFQNANQIYLSSADWMPRNFFSRLEIAFPVLDPRIFKYITEIVIPTYLADGAKARVLNRQGLWHARTGKVRADGKRSQFVFEDLARRRYRGTPIE